MLALALSLFASAPDWIVDEAGTRLVGHITRCDDQVEILTALGEFRFAASELREIQQRAELRRIFRETRRTAGDGDHADRSLAEWCLDRGLYDELYDTLDRILARDGGAGAADELLARAHREAILGNLTPVTEASPEVLDELVGHAVGSSPSRAAVACGWLARFPEADLVPVLERKGHSLDRAVRERCVAALSTLPGEPALKALIRSSLLDRDTQVREQALAAALDRQHPNLFAPYVKAMSSSQRPVREAAYEALGAIADPRAAPALISRLAASSASTGSSPRAFIFSGEQITYLQDFEVEIAQGAVIADPVIGILQQGALLDVRVFGVSGTTYIEKRVILKSLRRITGRDLGENAAAWKSWWLEEGRAAMLDKDAE